MIWTPYDLAVAGAKVKTIKALKEIRPVAELRHEAE